MIDFTKLNLSEGPTPVEQAASDNAMQSSENQKSNLRRQRQKDQMAQKSPVSKSGVVYASEEYFSELNKNTQLMRAQDKAKHNWRENLDEHRGAPATELSDEGDHPYIRLMPRIHRISQEKKEKKMQEIQSEGSSFEEAFGLLVEKEWSLKDAQKAGLVRGNPTKPVDHIAARRKIKSVTKPDTRTTAEKMADAYASPRKGAGGATKAD